MKYALAMSAALLLGLVQAQPALAQKNGNSLVNQAIAAEGGADALRALKALNIKADVHYWGPEQSETAGGPPRDYGTGTITMTWDLAKGMAATTFDRDQKYPAPEKLKYTEIVTPTAGAQTNERGATGMSGLRLATLLRELNRASPTLLLAALDDPKSVGAMGPQKMGSHSMPAVSLTAGGTKFTVLFDSKTHLPAVIRTRDDDNVFGDANYDLVLGDWKAVGSAKVAHSLSYQINGIEVEKITYKDVTSPSSLMADAFNIPDAAKATAKAPAKDNVPYQWFIRRQNLSRLADTDGVIYPPNGSLKLVELAPNVQHVQGAGANNLIVAMKDHLVVVDAPYGDLQSLQVIKLAKDKYPGKPIKTLILTHHHNDHSGGTRAFVAEGAEVIVPAPGKAHFDRTLKMPHTVVPDAEQKARKAVKVAEVKDTMSVKDDSEEIRLMNIPNPHVNGYLLVHVVKSNVVYTTDLLSPRGQVDRTPGTVAVGDALKKYNIAGATIAGGHGTTTKQSDIGPALGMVGAAR
jgi:glyoxylase-like metal-dependent hydrolase (beta-lactamase superfamily II)